MVEQLALFGPVVVQLTLPFGREPAARVWHTSTVENERGTSGSAGTWLMAAGVILLVVAVVGMVLPGPGLVFVVPGVVLLAAGMAVQHLGRRADSVSRDR